MSTSKEAKTAIELDECAVCGGNVKPVVISEWARPTKPEVTVRNIDCFECEDCGERFLNPTQLKTLERKTNEEIRKVKNYLSAEELDNIIDIISKKAGLSEQAIAMQIGISRQELHRWRTNDRIQSPLADTFFRYVAQEPDRFVDFVSSLGHPVAKPGRPKKKIS